MKLHAMRVVALTTKITLRGDSHYGRPDVIDFCDNSSIDFIFGLPGDTALNRAVDIAADNIRTRRALAQAPALRDNTEMLSWSMARRASARIENVAAQNSGRGSSKTAIALYPNHATTSFHDPVGD